MNKTSKTIITILVIIVLALLARYVVFRKQFDNWGAGLERVDAWQTEYKKEHPNATKAEMDAAFDGGIANIKVWQEKYKQEHPNATEAEMHAEFDRMWKK